MAADGHLGYTKMAITWQSVCRLTWCLVPGGVFGVRRSSGANFDDLEWPRIPVSRSQYSLKANIWQTVHLIHYIFGSRLGFVGGGAERMALFPVRQMAALSHVTGLSCFGWWQESNDKKVADWTKVEDSISSRTGGQAEDVEAIDLSS